MMEYTPLDIKDRAALAKLDNKFTDNGQLAMVSGEMTVEIARVPNADGDQFWMTVHFPAGETFDVRLSRAKLLEQLGVEDDGNT